MTIRSQRPRRRRLRIIANVSVRLVTTCTAFLVASILLWVVGTVVWRGFSSLTGAFAQRVGPGIVSAAAGSALVVALAFLMAVPLGLAAGVFIAEVDRKSRISAVVRFVADALPGIPAIVVGVVAYLLFVRIDVARSLCSGSVALAILMFPLIACATSTSLEQVAPDLREAAHALGSSPWRFLSRVLLPAAAPAIASAGLVGVARVGGEVAPLLLTAPASTGANTSSFGPTLHVQAYAGLLSSDPRSQATAWSAMLVLTLSVIALMLLARRFGRGSG